MFQIVKLKKVLHEKDENNDGYIDKAEFTEALQDIDNGILTHEIEEMYDNLTNNDKNKELSIPKFLQLIRKKKHCNDTMPKRTSMISSYSVPKHIMMNRMDVHTPKSVVRDAFPSIFGDENNRDVWGSIVMFLHIKYYLVLLLIKLDMY